jgi:O-phospho-L-seryl-tRNASec:L-selenocysteinyl-tRNA synthase
MKVTAAWRKGRVDAVVQSTDKNFMVPVGGAVVAASQKDPSLVAAVNKVDSLARPRNHHAIAKP